MTALCDRPLHRGGWRGCESRGNGPSSPWLGPWGEFVYYHSRFLAKRHGRRPSRLCAADKLAVALEPWWLYLPRVIASGESPVKVLSQTRAAKVEDDGDGE